MCASTTDVGSLFPVVKFLLVVAAIAEPAAVKSRPRRPPAVKRIVVVVTVVVYVAFNNRVRLCVLFPPWK